MNVDSRNKAIAPEAASKLELAWRMFNFGRFTGEEDPTLQKMRREFVELGGEAKDFPSFLRP